MRPWHVKRAFRFPSRSAADVRDDVAEEFRFHLDMRTADLVRSGLDETVARAQAVREFGDAAAGLRACAAIGDRLESRRRLARFLGELRQDLSHGARLLVRSPGFAAVAILTLAVGIGANTAVYSVLDAALFRPLPYPSPDRIVDVYETLDDGSRNSVSGGAYLDWRAHQSSFSALALTGLVTANFRGEGLPERLTGLEVSHEFLQVLGIAPLLGRGFLSDEDRPGGRNDVVLVTEELWRSRLASDPGVVGRTIVLDDRPRTVVGVLPRGAWIVAGHSFFVPAVLAPGSERAGRAPHWAAVFGRLAPGVSVERARADLKTIRKQLAGEYPPFKKAWGVDLQPATDVIGSFTRAPLLMLAGAVLLVLLIACANVANLLIARGCHRQRELQVRAALGAGRLRLVRQVMTENMVIAVLGGIGGLAVAQAGVAALRQFALPALPLAFAPGIDLRVLLFCLGATVMAGVGSGLLPALRATIAGLALGSGGRETASTGSRRAQSLLVLAEVSLAVVLLASTGLLVHSLWRVAAVDPGFDAARILAFDVSLPSSTYPTEARRAAFRDALLERLRGLPGVEAAGTGLAVPFSDGGFGEYMGRPDGRGRAGMVLGRVDYVSPGYLEALGARLAAGRRLTAADDRRDAARVAIINETTARRFFPGAPAIGETLVVAGVPWTVVGVVGDVADRALDAPPSLFAYCPRSFATIGSTSVLVRTSLGPASLLGSVQREILRLDGGVALSNPRGMADAMASSTARRKILVGLVGGFAGVALVLVTIGLYGLLAYSVSTRRREIGIRLAMGASPADLVRDVVRQTLRVAGAGLLIGLVASIGAARLLAGQLFGVAAADTPVIAGTAVVVAAIAATAAFLPARRAARLDPVSALRAE